MDNDLNGLEVPASGNPTNPTPGVDTTASVASNSSPSPTTIIQGEKQLADIVTGNVTGLVNSLPEFTFKEVADHRRETAHGFCETNANILREGQDNIAATKDARHDTIVKVDQTGDRLSDKIGGTSDAIRDKLWSLNRDIVDTKTQVQTGFVGVTKDVELNALKVQLDAAKNVTYLSDKIEDEGAKTRALINDLKYHDLNRGLVERNAELVECEADRRHWRHTAEQNQFQGQWAQLQSQIQAFASQLQETRQGMVNFGTMAGVGQSSTSNNVR